MFTLVPSHFFDPASAREALAEVADLKEGQVVASLDIPQYDAVLVYAQDGDSVVDTPEIYKILMQLLANSFPAGDFTTVQYYIFLSLTSLQLNPEFSTICWRTALDPVEEMSLYRYFKSVVRL